MVYRFKECQHKQVLTNHLNLGSTNPTGEKIEVNSLYFSRGGKPWIGVMGEMHYSRCNREEWHDRLAKMKAGGITIISTYLLWIYHEEIESEIDFTGDNDIREFILECRKLELDVVIRVGPWCHAECRNGGFPDWLLAKPYELRKANPGFMAQVKKWFAAISEQVKGLFYQDGGNIIAIQIENELIDDADYLFKLKELAIECGLVAPLYTVTGWNSAAGAKIPADEVVPVFGGYCDAPWENSVEKLEPSVNYFFSQMRNDSAIGSDLLAAQSANEEWVLPYECYPFATCELGAGLQGTHHRRYNIKGMDIYALSLVKLGVGNNLIGYYMYCGGTNKIGKLSTFQESSITGYNNDYPILSYDFQAPVSEYGEIREQYRLLNLLHLFIQDYGDILAPMSAVDAEYSVSRDDTSSLRYGMRIDGDGGFVFISNYQRLTELADIEDVVIDTGVVKFPAINISSGISFFMPFNMMLDGIKLTYATVQPLCRCGSSYFFAAIPGIEAQYMIDNELHDAKAGLDYSIKINGISIVTLTWNEARSLRRLDGDIYIGSNCDLYLCEGKICSAESGSFIYAKWNGSKFDLHEVEKRFDTPLLSLTPAQPPRFKTPYLYELNIGGGRRITWQKISVSTAEGMAEIECPACDAMQIYADGELMADDYYTGRPWRVPAKLLYGRQCYLAYSEMRNDFYMEF